MDYTGGNTVLLVEFTLNDTNRLNFFDVNLIDNYNLSMIVEPHSKNGVGNYTTKLEEL